MQLSAAHYNATHCNTHCTILQHNASVVAVKVWLRRVTVCCRECCSVMQYVAVCCSVLQCVQPNTHTTTHCSTLQRKVSVMAVNVWSLGLIFAVKLQPTATHFNTLQHPATPCNTLQHTASHCNELQSTAAHDICQEIEEATHCNTLQHTATHCNTLQHTATHTATHCNTLQHTATHCNTLCRYVTCV